MSSELTLEDAKVRWGYISLPVTSFVLATGGPLVLNGGGADEEGVLVTEEAMGYLWDAQSAPPAIATGFTLPPDLDDTEDMQFSFVVSKSGVTDSPTMTVACYILANGVARNSDTNCGGATSELAAATAAGVLSTLTLNIAAADIPASPLLCNITLTITTDDATNDSVTFYGATLKYKRKAQTLAG